MLSGLPRRLPTLLNVVIHDGRVHQRRILKRYEHDERSDYQSECCVASQKQHRCAVLKLLCEGLSLLQAEAPSNPLYGG